MLQQAREYKKDLAELSALAKEGKPVYGHSDLPEHIQGTAHRNSQWSQLKFAALPWCVNAFLSSLLVQCAGSNECSLRIVTGSTLSSQSQTNGLDVENDADPFAMQPPASRSRYARLLPRGAEGRLGRWSGDS